MSYCIMRMAKIKSPVALLRAARHNTREHQPLNADQTKTPQNWMSGGTTAEVMHRYSTLIPEKIRKNAVHAIEVVMTASPDFSGNWDGYLKACDQWARNLFGDANVLHVSHHHDETSPHSHILVIPVKNGRLNAKHFIGGSRDRMAELQNDFFQEVGRTFELERGQSRAETKARHTPHTLAVQAEALAKRETDIRRQEKNISDIHNRTAEDTARAISAFEELQTMTPEDFKALSEKIQQKKCLTFGEYRQKRLTETREQQSQISQQKKSHGFHR
jgi:hypothetical protein